MLLEQFHLLLVEVSCIQEHCESVGDYTRILYIQKVLFGTPRNLDRYEDIFPLSSLTYEMILYRHYHMDSLFY